MIDNPFQQDFAGTERFSVRRKLGSGTSGSVYEAYDRERKAIVALKTLNQVDPAAIYRFKKEFRALGDVNHRNLVQLYELLSDGDRWFFTMELVKGLPFTEAVRRRDDQPLVSVLADEAPTLLDQGLLRDEGLTLAHDAASTSDATSVGVAPRGSDAASEGESSKTRAASPEGTARDSAPVLPRALPFDPAMLRTALRQLAEGLTALHDTGKLHCDIKPSNVLATHEGRVVLLDLGLVREIMAQRIYESLEEDIVGTPAYMSPEQAAGLNISQASDWYSVGAVLYEALTGQIPFTGSIMRILTDKQRVDPPPPRELLPSIPEDLDTLCRALLHRDPEKRPAGKDVLRWLGSEESTASLVRSTSSSVTSAPFVGREDQMEQLMDSFRAARKGRTVAVFVHGSSGMGKSALVRRFLLDVYHQYENQVVVLTGRCYQRESVPYKALDSLVDSLSRYLRKLPEQEVEVLMPYNVLALARLFPVLRRVKAIANAKRRVLEIPDSRELRRRAFAALRELFLRLTDRHPVVLYIDDLQWGDLDSASLLNELLRPPDPPALMLLACFRSEEALTSPLLRRLFSSELTKAAIEVREVVLKELGPEESRRLTLQLLRSDSPAAEALAETIVRESGGNPFLIDTLVRYAQTVSGDEAVSGDVERAVGEATIEKVMLAHLDRLPEEARRLLEVISVIGQPVSLDVAKQAAEVEEVQAALAALRSANLIRLRGSSHKDDQVECYHDRIREIVPKLLEPALLKRYHLRLAQALQAAGNVDPEVLAIHFEEAGQRDRAAEFAAQAADQAAEALAFDRASRLYRIALDLAVDEGEAYRQLQIKLADALANAGRGAEAAQAYLLSAEGGMAADALELRRRAAEQLLISGRIDKGLATIRHVLESIGMKLAETPRQALLSLLRSIAFLKIRGLKFKERDSTQIAAEKLIQIDTCWSVSVGLAIVDTIRGMDYSKRNLLLSLKAGEPYRVARALCIETIASATSGNKGLDRTENLIRLSMRLAQKVNHPHALGLAHMTSGMAAYLEGHWQKAVERLDYGEEILRERCTGVTWELDTTMQFQLRALLLLGEYGEICRRLPSLLKDVQERGDLYAETNLRSRVTWVAWLVNDEPKLAEEEVEQSISRWSQQGFHLQHYWHMTGMVEIAMYSAGGLEAWRRLQELWGGLQESMLLRIQFTRTEASCLRARCALAAAVEAGLDTEQYKQLIKVVQGDLKKIESEKLFWSDPLALLLRAGIRATEGLKEEAEGLLEQAIEGLEKHDMRLYAAAARRRLGQLRGSRGKDLMRQADEWIASQSIKRTDLMANVLAPGGWAAYEL